LAYYPQPPAPESVNPGDDIAGTLKYAGKGWRAIGGQRQGYEDFWQYSPANVGGTWRAMGYGAGVFDLDFNYQYPLITLFLRVA
jgi:hypothetical protein